MHLKQLKLSGFKSFTDSTNILFPSHLVAVVGPNGCGKSNIIDAVRWVMGESSAKSLRGEQMTDVIFNGSTQRKAVGQALVELIFDNSLGQLAGQYSSYQEISVKRIVTRDGDSSYYLNGTRCRRKDIVDIFLGTGSGARGYSIISQGTISRLVEARPEELKMHLEEMAGVSKYKERRRETLFRLSETQENLARIAEVRKEVDNHLRRLEHHAKIAEQYKELKIKERRYRAEILVLKWQRFKDEQANKQHVLSQCNLECERHQAQVAEISNSLTSFREKLRIENENLYCAQENFYQLGTDIARLEEVIQQHRKEREHLTSDQQRLQAECKDLECQIQSRLDKIEASKKKVLQYEAQLREAYGNLSQQDKILKEKEEKKSIWDLKNQEAQLQRNQARHTIQMEEVRLKHLSQQRQQLLTRLEKIEKEIEGSSMETLPQAITKEKEELSFLSESLQEEETRYKNYGIQIAKLREQFNLIQQELHDIQDKIYEVRAEHAGLKATQGMLLKEREKTHSMWQEKSSLIEMIQVEKEWQHACEIVLGEGLHAIVLDSLEELWLQTAALEKEGSLIFTTKQQEKYPSKYPRLLDYIKGVKPCWHSCLSKIYTAMDLKEALTHLPELNEDESFITPDGYWLAKGWVKVVRPRVRDSKGLLLLQKLKELEERLFSLQQQQEKGKQQRDDLQELLLQTEKSCEDTKQYVLAMREKYREMETAIIYKTQTFQTIQQRKKELLLEKEELVLGLEELFKEKQEAEEVSCQAHKIFQEKEAEQSLFCLEQERWKREIKEEGETVNKIKLFANEVQLTYDREKIKVQEWLAGLERDQLRLVTVSARLRNVTERISVLSLPNESLQSDLDKKISDRQQLEATLNSKRLQVQIIARELESCEKSKQNEEEKVLALKEGILSLQIEEKALVVRLDNIKESLEELNFSLQEVLDNLPSEVTQTLHEKKLDELVGRIKRLGPINLAAIEEFEEEWQRKQHLDKQCQDLEEALLSLDLAIQKMDRETYQRLKNSFNELNEAFQRLFPRLFGGGHAMLEWTGENLLEGGLLVKAQPPGKRNNTIHLLSGGEKAMTAVALVFAIFQLNPSPFCMLDEVDAPLDDVNVRRFGELVKEMSHCVQFLIVTHNKVTMELADHLIGVTMSEPGVSRVVAVDVNRALSQGVG